MSAIPFVGVPMVPNDLKIIRHGFNAPALEDTHISLLKHGHYSEPVNSLENFVIEHLVPKRS